MVFETIFREGYLPHIEAVFRFKAPLPSPGRLPVRFTGPS